MIEIIKMHQLNIMLLLCGACGILVFLLINTRFLEKNRKRILILMEVMAFFLLWFDRRAYIYSGDISAKGTIMVRLANFMVFFLTSGIVLGFNLYLTDLLTVEGKLQSRPKRLTFTGVTAGLGMVLAVISAPTGLYYYFDEMNIYHRGPGFLIAYIIPVVCPIVQYTVIRQYRKVFSKLIYTSLILYIFVPILCGILQIFTYGISIVNMAMVAVSISLYIFMYLDLNNTVEHAHEIEIQHMQGEQERMKRLFDQTTTAFVSAVESRDDYVKGNALKIAQYSKHLASLAGKSEEECEKVYYAALLHDVGLIGISDKVIQNGSDPDSTAYEEMKHKPLIGDDILSSITEYPYLRQGAHYSHERYDGSGYPEGLKGEEIPEIARIIGVADAYVTMGSKKRYRDARPEFLIREAFVKGAGEEFDPTYAQLMVNIIDSQTLRSEPDRSSKTEKEIVCMQYRDVVSSGIAVERDVLRIEFECDMPLDPAASFSAPSIVLFDSFDGCTHEDKKSIDSNNYMEYGEIWFDRHCICTEARKIDERQTDEGDDKSGAGQSGSHFEIIAGRYDDHMRLIMRSKGFAKEVIVALPSGSKSSYIGLTGENCRIRDIEIEKTGESLGPDDISRIVDPLSFIDRFESDIHNVQVDRARSAYSEGVELKGMLEIEFHTMSLPGASLVWHCPYVLVYSSPDGAVGGAGYREYAMVKLNGETDEIKEFATNRFTMKRKEEFPGWDKWKAVNKEGLDCKVIIERKGDRIMMKTENLGITIENTTTVTDKPEKVYVALTGDQVALTDIRVNSY